MRQRVIVEGSRNYRVLQAGGLLAAAIAVLLPALTMSDFRVGQLSQVVVYAVALLGLHLVTGYSGQISLGHSAFFGLGAYTAAILVVDHGWPFLATLPVAGIAGLVVGLLVGVPALRLKGLYLALVTVAIGVTFPVIVAQPVAVGLGTGGHNGKAVQVEWDKPGWFRFNVSDQGWEFVVICAVAAIMTLLAVNIVRSRVGRAMLALRDNQTAAAAAGVWPVGTKTGAFALSGLYGAVGGALYIVVVPVVSPTAIGFMLSILFITAMVLGGAASVSGAWIGGLAMVYLPYFTSQWATQVPFVSERLTQPGLLANVLYGLLLIAVVFFLPGGIAVGLRRLRSRVVRIVPSGRVAEVVVPDSVDESAPESGRAESGRPVTPAGRDTATADRGLSPSAAAPGSRLTDDNERSDEE